MWRSALKISAAQRHSITETVRKSLFVYVNRSPIWYGFGAGANFGSLYVSGKLPTYPSPKPTLTLSSYLGQNVGLAEG